MYYHFFSQRFQFAVFIFCITSNLFAASNRSAIMIANSETELLLDEPLAASELLYPIIETYTNTSIEDVFNVFERGMLSKIADLRLEDLDPENLNLKNKDGMTLLNLAVKYSQIELVKNLIRMGSDCKIGDNEGWTPLMWAVGGQDIELVSYLVQKCPKNILKSKNQNGSTAVDIASFLGLNFIEDLLIEKTKILFSKKKKKKNYFLLMDQ